MGIFPFLLKGKAQVTWGLGNREGEIQSHQPPEAYVEQEHHKDEAGGGSFGVSRTAVEELGIMAIFLGES